MGKISRKCEKKSLFKLLISVHHVESRRAYFDTHRRAHIEYPQGARRRNNGTKQEKTQAERAQNVIGKFNKFVYCSAPVMNDAICRP